MTTTTEPTLVHVPPGELLIDLNIRGKAKLAPDFVASVREHGVLQPIVAVWDDDGSRLRVRFGQRRTLAAVETGQPTVPVYVIDAGDADTDRIIGQWHENEQRAALSTADKLAAVEQLALLGLEAGAIAKAVHAPKPDVEKALTAAGSKLARKSAQQHQFLTLDQAAALAEFDDAPDTAKALVAVAKTNAGQFPHALERARQDRAEADQAEALRSRLEKSKVTIIDPPDWTRLHSPTSPTRTLTEFKDGDGKPLTAAGHKKCEGHAAFIRRSWSKPSIEYVCTAWKAAGHKERYGGVGGRSETPQQTTEERREVLANNKAWKAATLVRRAWLRDFLARHTAPKDAAAYIAGELVRGSGQLEKTLVQADGHELLNELLGRDVRGRVGLAELVDAASNDRAIVLALGVVLCAIEVATDTQTWRRRDWNWPVAAAERRYMRFLANHGYVMADVEVLVAGKRWSPNKTAATESA